MRHKFLGSQRNFLLKLNLNLRVYSFNISKKFPPGFQNFLQNPKFPPSISHHLARFWIRDAITDTEVIIETEAII